MTSSCAIPAIAVASICADVPTFIIANNGVGDMLLPQLFTIIDVAGNDVTPTSNTFLLASGTTTVVTLPGLSPYIVYTFNTSGYAGITSESSDCAEPAIGVISVCVDIAGFIITNNGSGDMLLPQSFTVTDAAGNDVTPAPGAFQLAGGSQYYYLTLGS